jgi:hypothetical protein
MKKIEHYIGLSNIFGETLNTNTFEFYEYFSAFFSDEQIDEIKQWLKKSNIIEFALIRNVFVDESQRGLGLGKKLVNQFIKESNSLPILLIAGADDDFNLIDWYISLGFQTTKFECEDGPIMIKLNN